MYFGCLKCQKARHRTENIDSSLRRSKGGPRTNCLWTKDCWDHLCIQPPCVHQSLVHTPPIIQGAFVSLVGPGPMNSFSDVSEKLLKTRYTTQSVVCVMMWQLVSTQGSPMVCPYFLVIGWRHPPTKQTASHQQRAQPVSYFPAGIILARSSAFLNCLNCLKRRTWICFFLVKYCPSNTVLVLIGAFSQI